MFKIKHVLLLSFTIIALSIAGCKSQFEKLRLSNDVAKKYQEALRLYNKKKLLQSADLIRRSFPEIQGKGAG